MKKNYTYVYLLLGSALFSHAAFTTSPVVRMGKDKLFKEHIGCPNVQAMFDVSMQRAGETKVKFEFVPRVQGSWTHIAFIVNTSVPVGPPAKTSPVLTAMDPIQLSKDRDGWIITCRYQDDGKYGRVEPVPTTTLSISAERAKKCYVENAKTVTCVHAPEEESTE